MSHREARKWGLSFASNTMELCSKEAKDLVLQITGSSVTQTVKLLNVSGGIDCKGIMQTNCTGITGRETRAPVWIVTKHHKRA